MMRKFKFILILLTILLVIPFSVFADEGTTGENNAASEEVKLYFFHGDGCGYCASASEWFTEIEAEYGSKFEVVKYEVWNDEQNSNLMQAVAEARNESADGVPYIVIGNQSWNGFSDEYKEEILQKIDSEYSQEPSARYDIMNHVDVSGNAVVEAKDSGNSTFTDIIVVLAIVVVTAGITYGIIAARKSTN